MKTSTKSLIVDFMVIVAVGYLYLTGSETLAFCILLINFGMLSLGEGASQDLIDAYRGYSKLLEESRNFYKLHSVQGDGE